MIDQGNVKIVFYIQNVRNDWSDGGVGKVIKFSFEEFSHLKEKNVSHRKSLRGEQRMFSCIPAARLEKSRLCVWKATEQHDATALFYFQNHVCQKK